MINIVDCKNGKLVLIKIKIPNANNKLIEVSKIVKEKEESLIKEFSEFDINHLIFTLSILLDEFSKTNAFEGKLTKFKHTTISNLEKNQQFGIYLLVLMKHNYLFQKLIGIMEI